MLLSFADYAVLGAIFLVVALRMTADVRDVLMARLIKNAKKSLAGRKFLPRLTVVIPFHSLEGTKQLLEHLNGLDYAVNAVVAVDSKAHPKAGSALRYFITKQSFKRSKVTARKAPDLTKVAGEYAKTGLVVVLPETARLHTGLYTSAILPLADEAVGAVQLVRSVRPDTTLASGIETLCTSWKHYITANTFRRAQPTLPNGLLPEGILLRAKHVRKLPKQNLRVVETRRAVYSIAAQGGIRLEYGSILIMTLVAAALLSNPATLVFTAGVLILLHAVTVWWALTTMRVTIIDRMSILLLAPFYLVIAWSLVFARGIRSLGKAFHFHQSPRLKTE